MRSWIGGFLLAFLAAGLFGCSASGPRHSEMEQSLPSLGENEGRIYFYRNSILGAAIQPEVLLNGQVVGKSQPSSFFFVDRPAGSYRATARTEAEGSIDIALRPRQTAYIEMSISMGLLVGRPAFERVAEPEGRKALPSLAYGGKLPLTVKAAQAPATNAPLTPTASASPSVATATPVARPSLVPIAVAPGTQGPAATAAQPQAVTPASPVPAGSDATPFAKTSINDLRLLLQANR
ncbi:DUF2846 domain-containing protein [Variovorax paradoxus]|uniref:DUF2846 domain-containing protein n=1 Tax=Variovorax paradoxus TaxID=34073 RepID=A0A6I6HNG9_VARPD|nr:DUF2846 domain-containing protein [Variovorax paradoxus]QGW84365.1 DUF2846 domain-containing protein [Variovorax paradoxus]